MDFRKFRDVGYLEKLLERKTEELKGQRQKIEDIEQAIFTLMLYAKKTAALQSVERDLGKQRVEAEIMIETLETIVEGLEATIKEKRGNKDNDNNE